MIWVLVFIGAFLFFFIYLLADLIKTNPNAFLDKWIRKTLWAWLPFYALWRLVREVILGRK